MLLSHKAFSKNGKGVRHFFSFFSQLHAAIGCLEQNMEGVSEDRVKTGQIASDSKCLDHKTGWSL